jgi:chromosome segregation ATPase
MDLIVVLLSSISGALIGTSVGIYMLYRKLRPITGAELDLTRGKLRSAEFTLASTSAGLDKLRKELEEREQQLSAAEERARAAESQIAQHEAKIKDATEEVAASASQQIAAYEARIGAGEQQIRELSEKVARRTAELDQLKCDFEQESKSRSTLETQLSGERENSRELASRIAELESERSHWDLTLQEERQSAAKGIELLLMAQENLTRVFRSAPVEVPRANGDHNGQVLIATAVAPSV